MTAHMSVANLGQGSYTGLTPSYLLAGGRQNSPAIFPQSSWSTKLAPKKGLELKQTLGLSLCLCSPSDQ